MFDPRFEKLADVLVNHSTKIQPGENALIEAIDIPEEMVIALIRKVREAGGKPLVTIKQNRIQRELIRDTDEKTMQQIADVEAFRMDKVQVYFGLRGSYNIAEMSDVTSEKMGLYEEHWLKPVHFKIRVPKTKWCVLRWPTPSMAQQARKSTEEFEKFYFDVCTLDYDKMATASENLKAWMQKTERVHIKGPGTDLQFSIKDIPAIPCSGSHNIPDGEVFTAPVRDSINGTIRYTADTIYQGTVFSDINLTFENGKVVKATSSDTEKLNAILDTDEGARYVGEFAIGFNPYITDPMLDILFDEKIAGSFHFTPGQAYDDADNGNRSNIHWDMVCIQTPEYGGGEIWFDDTLIRKDGIFVVKELEALNPENLK
ncbi:MAG: aminopeptidase [Calditrichaeota bacterium]|nr:MAG: aminopeptidase [Calditrichota bacterium]MBL1207664.1 aminopeptidase [Calditrichota bacterium]NOG47497.1 aminopeptidase [Calditrichota bacterium]